MFILLVDFRPQSSLLVAQEIQWKNNLNLVVVGVHPRRVPVVDISSATGKKNELNETAETMLVHNKYKKPY